MSKIYKVNEKLPNPDQRVMCYGRKTYCCVLDAENEAWHEVIFSFDIHAYSLKKSIPENPEESILKSYVVFEEWNPVDIETEPGQHKRIIGVTEWKAIDE